MTTTVSQWPCICFVKDCSWLLKLEHLLLVKRLSVNKLGQVPLVDSRQNLGFEFGLTLIYPCQLLRMEEPVFSGLLYE